MYHVCKFHSDFLLETQQVQGFGLRIERGEANGLLATEPEFDAVSDAMSS
jgi:hypothetical protein